MAFTPNPGLEGKFTETRRFRTLNKQIAVMGVAGGQIVGVSIATFDGEAGASEYENFLFKNDDDVPEDTPGDSTTSGLTGG